jgi:hypothetical protein
MIEKIHNNFDSENYDNEVMMNKLDRAWQKNDAEVFVSTWSQLSPDFKLSYAQSFGRIENDKLAQRIYDNAKNTYSDENEDKKSLIMAFSKLGAHSPELQEESTNYLLELVDTDQENKPEIIMSLKEKAMTTISPMWVGQSLNESEIQRICKIVPIFLEILNSSETSLDEKKSIVSNLFTFARLPELKEEIITTLQHLSLSQDDDLQSQAFDQLIEIGVKDDEVNGYLHGKMAQYDPNSTDPGFAMALARQMGKVADTRYVPFLRDLLRNENAMVQWEANNSLNKIEKRDNAN